MTKKKEYEIQRSKDIWYIGGLAIGLLIALLIEIIPYGEGIFMVRWFGCLMGLVVYGFYLKWKRNRLL